MTEMSGGQGGANDAAVKAVDNAAAAAEVDQAYVEAQAKAERRAEVEAAERAVEKAEDQLKSAKDALAQARKGN